MHPGTAASPASPLGILQQAQALNQQMSTAAAAQQPAPPDSPEFPRPGQARGDMSPRKRRSWLAKLAFLKKRRMRQQDASPERSAGGYTSTLGSPLSGVSLHAYAKQIVHVQSCSLDSRVLIASFASCQLR